MADTMHCLVKKTNNCCGVVIAANTMVYEQLSLQTFTRLPWYCSVVSIKDRKESYYRTGSGKIYLLSEYVSFCDNWNISLTYFWDFSSPYGHWYSKKTSKIITAKPVLKHELKLKALFS
jgi:hypothetical protein